MRFSLATLLLLMLFVASLAAIWVNREPWVLDLSDYTFASATQQFPERNGEFGYSPDGQRRFHNVFDDWGNPKTLILDVHSNAALYDPDAHHLGARFLSNDAILFFTPEYLDQCALYRRRFPEWWWGHFYRPEVWLSVVLGGVLVWRFVRSRRASKKLEAA